MPSKRLDGVKMASAGMAEGSTTLPKSGVNSGLGVSRGKLATVSPAIFPKSAVDSGSGASGGELTAVSSTTLPKNGVSVAIILRCIRLQ